MTTNTSANFTKISPNGDIYYLEEDDLFLNEGFYRDCITPEFELLFRSSKDNMKFFTVVFRDGEEAVGSFSDNDPNLGWNEIVIELIAKDFGILCNYIPNETVKVSLWKNKFEDGIDCYFELNRDFQEIFQSFLEGFGLQPKRAEELSKIVNRFKTYYEKYHLSLR